MTFEELKQLVEAAVRKEDGAIDVLADVIAEYDIVDPPKIDETIDAPEARRMMRSHALAWACDMLEQMHNAAMPPLPVYTGDAIAVYGPPPIRTIEGAFGEFSLILESRADRVQAIRVLRDASRLSLSEAAAKVDQLPLLIAEELMWGDAEDLRVRFERAGCAVRIRHDR